MNVREGVRRIAISLGVCGALAGGFGSYLVLQDLHDKRAQYEIFREPISSDAVAKLTNDWFVENAPDSFRPDNPQVIEYFAG